MYNFNEVLKYLLLCCMLFMNLDLLNPPFLQLLSSTELFSAVLLNPNLPWIFSATERPRRTSDTHQSHLYASIVDFHFKTSERHDGKLFKADHDLLKCVFSEASGGVGAGRITAR